MTSMRILTISMTLLLLATPAAASDQVIFGSAEGLVVRDLNTGERRPIDADGADPQWFPDDNRVAFLSPEGVRIAWFDTGRNPELIVNSPSVGSFDLSSDGRAIVYSGATSVSRGLHVVTLDNDGRGLGGPFALTNPVEGRTDSAPRWSPDGTAVVFNRSDADARTTGLWVAEVPTAFPAEPPVEHIILDPNSYDVRSPATWFPDQSRVMVQAIPRTGTQQSPPSLYAISRSGRATELVVQGGSFAPGDPVVAPDGEALAYSRHPWGDGVGDGSDDSDVGIWVHDLLSSDLSQGVDSQLASNVSRTRDLSWTADAQQVIYESITDDSGCHCELNSIYAVAEDGRTAPVLIEDFSGPDGFAEGPRHPAVAPGVTRRLSGPTRIETAVAVSRERHQADTVILARADAYPDALAGAPLAAGLSPLLLSGQDALSASVAAEIVRLGAQHVILLGDETALSATVEQAVLDLDSAEPIRAERIAGSSRFGTAAMIAARIQSAHAYVVEGGSADPARGWPDAVAAAGAAAFDVDPLLLVEYDRLPQETARAITDGGITDVTIVGGEVAVSQAVADDIADLGVTVERIAGATRYETSALVARRTIGGRAQFGVAVDFATGNNWPDTLAVAARGGNVLLVDGVDYAGGPALADFLVDVALTEGTLAGGPDVLRPELRVTIERLARQHDVAEPR